MIKKISATVNKITIPIAALFSHIKKDIQKRPVTNFFLSLLIFILLIILGNVIQSPLPAAELQQIEPKTVRIFRIGSSPRMKVQAQIEKTGVVTIMSLSSGIVNKVHVHEGDEVAQGKTLISLSSNYAGGNAFSLQRQLAEIQYTSALETFDLQKDLVQQQRNVATVSAENAAAMRDIAGKAREDTRNLMAVNELLLARVNESLSQLDNNPQANPELLGSLQGQKAQLLGALAQARVSQASADYQSAGDKPPAELATLQKEITLKQLTLQEKMLNVQKESARLQLQLAQIAEGLMYPASPVTGIVQRIYVKENSIVSPGTPLMLLSRTNEANPVTAVAYVPQSVAAHVSVLEPSKLIINKEQVSVYPAFVSTEAVQGNSYAIYYAIPEEYSGDVLEKGFIQVEVPIGYADTSASVTYVPIDSVYQTAENTYLFVVSGNMAESRTVITGNLYGSFVEITKGLFDGDDVIVSRNVINGDPIKVEQ